MPFIAPGPFARLVAIHFPGLRFRWRIVRDDGLVVTPQETDRITLHLYAHTGAWLFSGLSVPDPTLSRYPSLHYEALTPDSVSAFAYRDGYYEVTLNGAVLKEALGIAPGALRCSLVTEGDNTLETRYPRVYTDVGTPHFVAPGTWEVTIPFWSVRTTDSYPSLVTTVRTTTVQSSVPYEATYRVTDGNAAGRFLLPWLGVVWRPNADLSGWLGQFQVENVCTGGEIAMPWQYPAIAPPSPLPRDPTQRIHILYANVVLQVALGPCPDGWAGSTLAVASSWGYEALIPFRSVHAPAFQAIDGLGRQEASLSDRTFVRYYAFQWERSTFQYDTGTEPSPRTNQTAVLVQSPAIDFEQLTFVPLPETTG